MNSRPPPDHPRTPFGQFASWARRPLLRAFRVTPQGRVALVTHMLTRQVHDAPMYWLQLILAMSIATLGLALGSNVVVIGAMLISPLMSPIVELGMGLAVGLPVLAGRSFARVAVSAGIVVVGATLITLALPFHELTPPIVARSAPTVLDLLIAICCAVMASFATAVAGSGTTSTAAGTAVAIALVPPLCVVGFGLGTGQFAIAEGAALLFTANFSAIMLFAVLTFTAFGYGEHPVGGGTDEAGRSGVARLGRGRAFGATLRILLPLVLLGIVFVPLRRALAEVAWEVRTRQAVREELSAVSSDTVRSAVDVVDHTVRVQLVILGNSEDASALERRLALRIAAAAGVLPNVEVRAVPKAEAMREALQAPSPAIPPLVREPDLKRVTSRVSDVLERNWPASSAGALVAWRLDIGPGPIDHVEVVHFGAPLGGVGEHLLGRILSEPALAEVRVADIVLPSAPIASPPAEGALWLAEVTPVLDQVARFETLYACVQVPGEEVPATADGGTSVAGEDVRVRAALDRLVAALSARSRTAPGPLWSLQVQTNPCAEELPDAGPDSDPIAASEDASTEAAGDDAAGHD